MIHTFVKQMCMIRLMSLLASTRKHLMFISSFNDRMEGQRAY